MKNTIKFIKTIKILNMTCTIFNTQCSEEFRDIIVGINCDNSELQVYHKNNGIVYKKQSKHLESIIML